MTAIFLHSYVHFRERARHIRMIRTSGDSERFHITQRLMQLGHVASVRSLHVTSVPPETVGEQIRRLDVTIEHFSCRSLGRPPPPPANQTHRSI